jgi:23S rRNA (cytidine1920-2'-O)/16S rRNA (cytidine1409-2'-O)-methyltransferase
MGEKPAKVRLDLLIVERKLAESRTQAQAMLLAGRIKVPSQPAAKAGTLVPNDIALELIEASPYVSRGGEKLSGLMEKFSIDVTGKLCWDVGASTGGFTDYLLQHGATKVIAIDVGHGQLHWKLQKDPRVVNQEKLHILDVEPGQFPSPQFITIDVSFISLEKVLPHLAKLTARGTEFAAMVKPQFEAGPKGAPKGVVRDPEVRAKAIAKIRNALPEWGFRLKGEAPSALPGPKGNLEHFLYIEKI